MENEGMEKPNYFAIIPANVRYANIIPNAKLLYGEISALTNKEGYCWASNAYFARLYGCNVSAVKRWLHDLAELGVIQVNLDETKTKRQIFLIGWSNNRLGVAQKRATPQPKNGLQNSTGNRTIELAGGSTPPPQVFSLKEEKQKMEENKRRDLNIIALFMDYRFKTLVAKITNRPQLALFIRRHLRPAGQLKRAEYTDAQLVDAFDAVSRKYKDIDWTLETVVKELTK